jgi:hypothetical protein
MTTGEIVQIVSIVILSGITGYYAFQTKRQADILSKQVDVANRQQKIELLNEIIQWAEDASRLGIEQGSQDMISHLDSDGSLEFLSKQANKLILSSLS